LSKATFIASVLINAGGGGHKHRRNTAGTSLVFTSAGYTQPVRKNPEDDEDTDQDRGFDLERVASAPVVISHTELEPETLRRVIEAHVLREGTEYGSHEVSLAQKVAQVMTQLTRGDATIAFHPDTESVDIVATRDVGRPGKPAL
jgi:uncharacterized protein